MRLEMFALQGLPEIRPGDDLGEMIARAMQANGHALAEGDILAVAQKVVSKAEGRFRTLSEIMPTARAMELAEQSGKDARKVQAILDESTDILRVVRVPPDGIIIARHRQGWVCANAGIDESNLGHVEGRLLLLPEDADASAKRIARRIADLSGVQPGVVVTDTFGRPWRRGLVNIALGCSGVEAIVNWIGRDDAYGKPLAVTQQAFADEIAAASGLLMAKDGGTPVVVLRGLKWQPGTGTSGRSYVRPLQEDLFR